MVGLLTQLFDSNHVEDAASDENPFVGELFSIEHLEQHAALLACKHKVFSGITRGLSLSPRLEENKRVLRKAYKTLSKAIRTESGVSPAAEWLVDNFHIVEEQLREIKEDLPVSYYNELPKLSEGELSGYPRIYAIALALISHTDSRIDVDTLKRFIRAYQQNTVLSIGELWAAAITLRIALVENLRRVAARIIAAREQREEADALADKLMAMSGNHPDKIIPYLEKQFHEHPAFIIQLTQRLRDQDPAVATAIDWMDSKLVPKGLGITQVAQIEHQRQASSQVTIANIITSMRLLSTLDWKDFFESVNLIDPLLDKDPAGAYSQMDFAARDCYRHIIERISKQTNTPELKIAERLLEFSQQERNSDAPSNVASHIGYYLIDEGLPDFERACGYKPLLRERAVRFIKRSPTAIYMSSIILFTVLIIAGLAVYAAIYNAGFFVIALLVILSLILASDLAVSIVNRCVTFILKPNPLPKMDMSSGIPEDACTMVVVPTMLTDEESVNELVERLEIHYLANKDDRLYFALLTDFTDSEQEEMPDDDLLLETARAGIDRLNKQYCGNDKQMRFHLFHRKRLWNESENMWIGWERKRGKLREFNSLLRGTVGTSFVVNTAEQSLLSQIRFVITLDSDTQLPRDAARRLVGTILHPLNQPFFDARSGRVTRGYGILQPRVSIAHVSASQSRFAHVFSGNTGVDPYTTAVSDVYQDLFGEGIYTGKGLYAVDVFEQALEKRVPDNSLLSHDLFEGLFARPALVTDIELFDDYPTQYDVYSRRLHRWTRGDWQIAGWILPRVPVQNGEYVKNNLPLISRWKITDNLRRSLVSPLMVLWLITAWTLLPGSQLFWTLFILLSLAFPVYTQFTVRLFLYPKEITWKGYVLNLWEDARFSASQLLLNIAFTAHQSYLMTDAILRTLHRKLVSHKRLIEWTTAAQDGRVSARSAAEFFHYMYPSLVIAAAALALILVIHIEALLFAWAFLLVWICSPLIAHSLSYHYPQTVEPLEEKDARFMRLVARRTWRYFETFVGEEDHWLPPDNYQEDPAPVVAHRTSPTNVGLLLLSTIAAHDFGYVGTYELIERFELTFTNFEKLQQFRGHFFNWYDTRTLEPLSPKYISTVDSGNLAGHLIVIKQECREVLNRPIVSQRVIDGLTDTVRLMVEELERLDAAKQRTYAVTAEHLHNEIKECVGLIENDKPRTLSGWLKFLKNLSSHLTMLDDIVNSLAHEHGVESFTDLRFWLNAMNHQTQNFTRDIQTLAPWADAFAEIIPNAKNQYPEEFLSELKNLARDLDTVPSPSEIPEQCDRLQIGLAALRLRFAYNDKILCDIDKLTQSAERAIEAVNTLSARANSLARLCDRFADEMDFHFLFDEKLKVLTIGYNVGDRRLDNSFYDLLASEARLASFIAIATGDVYQEHWFRMGRQLTAYKGKRALVSWSASMFEYLMPLLIMQNYKGTLLDETYKAVVERQIAYGREHGISWGVSESAYNARDLQLTYQYGPFGVPGLGLKRGLSDELVIAPYATLLAAMVKPQAAVKNLHRLEREGALNRYGFYEAIDYTPDRLQQNQKKAIIQAFMTHHQGMSLVAINNLLNDNVMQRRFHADPFVKANELLLQERVPRSVAITYPRSEEIMLPQIGRTLQSPVIRRYNTAELPLPHLQLLSNGNYSVMITTAGAGYSACGSLAVTRWREDTTRDNRGSFIYLRDVRSNAVWSAGYQPTLRVPQSYEVSFSEDKVGIVREDVGILTRTDVIVSAEENAELRRVSLTNQSSREREIELTSYAEIVLAPLRDDISHPAFGNLFVETEFFSEENALLARRRPRSEKDREVWGIHVVVTDGETNETVEYETDRSRFLGRGRSPEEPAALIEERPLSNSSGAVLDPVFSLRQRVKLKPAETVHVTFTTAVAASRDDAMRLADKYHEVSAFDREARLAWTKSRVEMRHLDVDLEDAQLFQELAGRLLYLEPSLRPRPHVLELNSKTQSGLWQYGISGDLPIILVRANDESGLSTVRQLLRGHEYLRMKGLAADLVILNDHPPSYAQTLQDDLLSLIRKSGQQHLMDKPGGIFLRRTDLIPDEDRILLHTVARVCIVTERGTLEEQLSRSSVENELPPPFIPRWASKIDLKPKAELPDLKFFNGLGGFTQDGREYVTVLGDGQWTPAPWANVVANSQSFGFLVSENGAGYTWSVNSRENRLTPWSNDAVTDPCGEVIYLRDEDTGAVWTPTPLPIRESNPYVIRHGQGYTVFEHTSHGIKHELKMFVPTDAPVKISILRLNNHTTETRRLSVTNYNELVLGNDRAASLPFVITEMDKTNGTIFARNPYNNEFAERIAFVAMSETDCTMTCDRKEFLGRNGLTTRPAALRRTTLSGRAGAGYDPCAAIQNVFELEPYQTREIVILLGESEDTEQARAIVSKYRKVSAAKQAFEEAKAFWDDLLGTIEVTTPDAAMNIMLNRWLLYQTLSCRVWTRAAFYQSSGAYGFRDQLQDVMALVYAKPSAAREHILRAASRQFPEGDVQHWWHPPTGRGLRTRFSDDPIWLPLVTTFYVNATGDVALLDECVPFLDSQILADDEVESYTQPAVSTLTANLFEHCARALDKSLTAGAHGLPLMGCGDWNDGMNRIGHKGKGESVWVGWFLYKVLNDFLRFCEARNENERAERYRAYMKDLKRALEDSAWDGNWYVRAFFDDGTPLGSAQNDDCRIDLIAQSWGVISGAADVNRAKLAMKSVEENLILRGEKLVLLLAPPFDKGTLEPGYIKGYLPGVRENGGQYTHAALWTLIAYTGLGDGDRAFEIFAMLNPVNHSLTRAGIHKYRIEPYVAAADVYALPLHIGRGGWTWHTGAAGWMYRAGLESILGFKLCGDSLIMEPCVPREWQSYEIKYRRGKSIYQIKVENPHKVNSGVASVEMDGSHLSKNEIPLEDDGNIHRINIIMGET